MQLPGMSTEPVRVALEVTWWPHDGTWGLTRRGWRRNRHAVWDIEEMMTNGTPLSLAELKARLDFEYTHLLQEIDDSDDPFSTVGAFK